MESRPHAFCNLTVGEIELVATEIVLLVLPMNLSPNLLAKLVAHRILSFVAYFTRCFVKRKRVVINKALY